jgi:integrase/recombinase XerD
MSTAPLITIFVRHSADCKYRGDEFEKRCRCRKHFRWSHNGVQQRRKANTRSWAEADEKKRELEDQLAGRTLPSKATDDAQTIRAALTFFQSDKKVSGLDEQVLARHARELGRFASFCETSDVYTVAGITPALVTEYKATWTKHYSSSFTRANVQKRLRGFLKFCLYNGWLPRVPKMTPVRITEPQTTPITEKEYKDIQNAVPRVYPNGYGKKLLNIIRLMRWSGLAVRDASSLRRDELKDQGTYFAVCKQRQKMVSSAGTDKAMEMYIPIPLDLGRELTALENKHPDYVFWEPRKGGNTLYFSHNVSVAIGKIFAEAGVHSEGHMISHRLRDTFAVDLLTKGVPLEDVSKLLGHTSIRTTEQHYAKWVKGRQDRLDRLVMDTWKG